MLYVSHRMQEIFSVRRRHRVARRPSRSHHAAVRKIDAGGSGPPDGGPGSLGHRPHRAGRSGRPVVLSVRGLTREPAYRDISFDVHAGEIVAFAGLVGAGRSEVMLGIFGSPPPDRGEIMLDGARCASIASSAFAGGISLMPGGSQASGAGARPSGRRQPVATADQIVLRSDRVHRHGRRERLINDCIERFHIKTPDTTRKVGQLSGGNQQKVVLAKWLATKPRVLIVDEPTRGVDVGSKAQIYAFLRELAAAGLRHRRRFLRPPGGAGDFQSDPGDARRSSGRIPVRRGGRRREDHVARRPERAGGRRRLRRAIRGSKDGGRIC